MKRAKAIVLAAGKGKRMETDIPKVLNLVAGKPIIEWIVEALEATNVNEIFIVVSDENRIDIERFLGNRCNYVLQKKQMGTAHAVLQVENFLKDFNGNTFVMVGDAPGIKSKDLMTLQHTHEKNKNICTFLTAHLTDKKPPWGRIIRDCFGKVMKIVEEREATEEELKVNEISSSHFIFDNKSLFVNLHDIKNNNVLREYYLSDIVELLSQKGKVETVIIDDILKIYGTNTKEELERINKYFSEVK